jgi:hypothetical protein
MANGNSTSIDAGKAPRSPDDAHTQEIKRLAHDLSCLNGIEFGAELDALNALLEINFDWAAGVPAPISERYFISLLECVRSKIQHAKNEMEGLIADLEKEVPHGVY